MTPPHDPIDDSSNRRDAVDLRDDQSANQRHGVGPQTPAAVREVLESAADVIFSDGVSAEFLDQWTFETVQLLEARARERARDRDRARRPLRRALSAGRR